MIIGGQAVLLYGEPRLTKDIDITLGINIDRLDEFLAVVKDLSLAPLPVSIFFFQGSLKALSRKLLTTFANPEWMNWDKKTRPRYLA